MKGKSDQRIESKQYRRKTVSHVLPRTIFDKLTCRLLRTAIPDAISPKNTKASKSLPSSTDVATNPGKPKMLSHLETDFDATRNTQNVGSQSVLVTFGFSRMSRRNRKAIKPSVNTS